MDRMCDSPFSPSFSIRPERFFGRKDELNLMRDALRNPDSPNRYLFLTGTRGCGKTSLLHQFALVAADEMGWTTIESTYQDCLESLKGYAGLSSVRKRAKTISPTISAGSVSASALSATTESTELPASHLAQALVASLSKKKRDKGLIVLIDEVQKISEADMEEVCHAVQAARTAGLNIALVIAGLPVAYAKIRRYPGCTFVQRMKRRKLGMLTMSETRDFLDSMFGLVPEITVEHGASEEMAEFSGGHPYLLQLIGDYACAVAFEQDRPHGKAVISLDGHMVREAERRSLADYQQNVLSNLLVGLRNGTLEYLRALCDACDEQSTARSSDVADALGKTLQECSTQRARIVDLQLAIPISRGFLRLALPYLPLAFEPASEEPTHDLDDMWAPRKTPFPNGDR